MNFQEMSDEELNAYINTPVQKAIVARQEAQSQPNPPEDTTQGMSDLELAGAGAGLRLHRIPRGIKEMGIGMFGTPEDLAKYNAEKAARTPMEDQLMKNWAAKAGSFGVDMLTAGALPARTGPQIVSAIGGAAASPTQRDIKGLEAPTRLMQGAEAGATTGLMALPMRSLGKAIGAVRGNYSPEGVEAMRLNEAAKRLGVNRNVGGLDPSSSFNAFESNMPGYARTVEEQAKAFTNAAREVKDIPSKSGKSFESRNLEGEKLRQGITEAGENLQAQGKNLWEELDSYIVQNNLPGVAARNAQIKAGEIIQNYTPINKKGMQLDKNPILQRINEYDPDSATLLTQLLSNPKAVPQVAFSDLHQLSAAVGKAYRRAEKDAAAPGAPVLDRKVRTELKNLYGSLMSDVDSWGTKNPAAQKMFEDAKTFWRDAVVPGVQTNKVFGKASKGVYGMNPRGYSEPAQLYSDVVKNPRAMQDLYPYMSQNVRDMTDTLNTMPDMARSLVTNSPHPPAPGMGTLTTLAGMSVGSPLQLAKGMISHAPGFNGLVTSEPAKRFYFAKDALRDTPLGRTAWALNQYPQEGLQGMSKDLRERGRK